MSKARGCGAAARGLRGTFTRAIRALKVERLESRCVLSVSVADPPGPSVPPPAEAVADPPAAVVTTEQISVATSQSGTFTNTKIEVDQTAIAPVGHGVPASATFTKIEVDQATMIAPAGYGVLASATFTKIQVDQTSFTPPGYGVPPIQHDYSGFDSGQTADWRNDLPTNSYSSAINYVQGGASVARYHDTDYLLGLGGMASENRASAGFRPYLVPASDVPPNLAALVGTDQPQVTQTEHSATLDPQSHTSSEQTVIVARPLAASTNQPAYPANAWASRVAYLVPVRGATELIQLLFGNRTAGAAAPKSASNQPAAESADQDTSAQAAAGDASLTGAGEIADLLHRTTLAANIPLDLSGVQHALDTVMGDVKLLGTELSQWLEGIHFTPVVLAVAAATAGAGSAAYLRRRGGREAGQRDDEASSSWLFARLQAIPVE